MTLSRWLPVSSQIELCRSLRHYLSSGLTLVDVFRSLASRGSSAMRPFADRVLTRLEQGDELQDALYPERDCLPPLLLSLAQVGEQSGNLPEICGELERYLIMQQRLRRQFWGQAAWPLFQLGLAILVIAGLILLIDVLPAKSEGTTPDPLGFGLVGASGALTFLMIVISALVGVAAGYVLLTRVLRQKSAFDRILLHVPIVGPCLEAFALARICLALRLTLDSSMPIAHALRLSLRAADNAAYETVSDVAIDAVKSGQGLTETLSKTGIFPLELQAIFAVGEESGRLPEALGRQVKNYQEIAEERLKVLAQAASWGVWFIVAGMILFVIFRIFTGFVLPAYDQ